MKRRAFIGRAPLTLLDRHTARKRRAKEKSDRQLLVTAMLTIGCSLILPPNWK